MSASIFIDAFKNRKARTPNRGEFFVIPRDGALPEPLTNNGFYYSHGDLDAEEWTEMEVKKYI